MESVGNRGDAGGGARSDAYDVERLEKSTRQLVDLCQRLQRENERLELELSAREARIAELDAQVVAGDDRRAAAQQRVDQLISRLDWVDGQLAKAAERSKPNDRGARGERRGEKAPAAGTAPTPSA